MTWPDVAAAHVGHRAVLRDPMTLECVQCSMKLLIPLRPDLAPTPTPSRWTPPEDGHPMPAGWKQQVAAELAARKQRKETT